MAKYTIDDFIKLNPIYKKGWDDNTKTATLTNTANNKSINFGINQGQQYGIGSADNEAGSHYVDDVNKLIGSLAGDNPATTQKDLSGLNTLNMNPSAPMPEYKSPYETQINEALNKVLNPGTFSYNYAADPTYQSYAQQYTRAGEEAFQDTIGDLSALTGGRLNTWATSAASQAKNKYMQDLNNIIPQLEQNAYNKYLQNYQNIVNQLKTLQGLDESSYNRYNDDYKKTQDLQDKEKQNFIDTMGQYYNDYQAQINTLEGDNDTSNDWQIPYLKIARQQKIQAQQTAEAKAAEAKSAAAQQEYKNALEAWKISGVATPYMAYVLGVPEGAVTSDYDIQSINAATTRMNAQTNAYEAETGRINAGTSAKNAETSRMNANENINQNASKNVSEKVKQYKDQIDQLFSTPIYDTVSGNKAGYNYDYTKIKEYLMQANKAGYLKDDEARQIMGLYGLSEGGN